MCIDNKEERVTLGTFITESSMSVLSVTGLNDANIPVLWSCFYADVNKHIYLQTTYIGYDFVVATLNASQGCIDNPRSNVKYVNDCVMCFAFEPLI